MKKFIKLTALIEPVLKESEMLFEEGNKVDLTVGGEDYEIEDIFFVLESYVANVSIKQGEIIFPKNMKEFIEKVWDVLWTISSLSDSGVQKWISSNEKIAFVKIKIEDRNYSKQLCLIKIVNEIFNQTYDFNLIAVL